MKDFCHCFTMREVRGGEEYVSRKGGNDWARNVSGAHSYDLVQVKIRLEVTKRWPRTANQELEAAVQAVEGG